MQPRMIGASFKGNPYTTIFCYCPTNTCEEKDHVLQLAIIPNPKHNVLIIGGDMNSQIGKGENNKFDLNNPLSSNGAPVV